LDIYINSLMKQQYTDRHISSFWHIIPTPNQSIFVFTS